MSASSINGSKNRIKLVPGGITEHKLQEHQLEQFPEVMSELELSKEVLRDLEADLVLEREKTLRVQESLTETQLKLSTLQTQYVRLVTDMNAKEQKHKLELGQLTNSEKILKAENIRLLEQSRLLNEERNNNIGKNFRMKLVENRNDDQEGSHSHLQYQLALAKIQEKEEIYKKTHRQLDETYRKFNELKTILLEERKRRETSEEQLRREQKEKNQILSNLNDADQVRSELFHTQRNEKTLKLDIQLLMDQFRTVSDENRRLQIDKKNIQLELDLQNTMLENLKSQERLLKENYKKEMNGKKADLTNIERLSRENNYYKSKLLEFQSALKELKSNEEKYKAILSEHDEKSFKFKSMKESFENAIKSQKNLEEQVIKEKRDKELALKCLHEAESKLSMVSQELTLQKQRLIMFENERELKLQF